MALTISGTRIFLTRGDTLKIRLTLQRVVDGSQTEYEPQAGDQIRFALKHKTMNNARTEFVDTEPILTKIIPVSDMILQLDPEDTAEIGFGEYVYDIQVTFEDGTVDTVIANSAFVLTPEVD